MRTRFLILSLLSVTLASACKNLGDSQSISDLTSTGLFFREGPGTIARKADAGAGTYASMPWTWEKWRSREFYKAQLVGAGWIYGADAAKHLRHYFENTGSQLAVDAKRFFSECPAAKRLYFRWLREAFKYAGKLSDGEHSFSLSDNDSGQCAKDESLNWYYATNGFNVFFKATANVDSRVSPTWRTMTFVAQYYDRYNWDVGDSFEINNVKTREADMGEFHLMGLAKEYDLYGESIESFSWRDGQGFEVLLESSESIK